MRGGLTTRTTAPILRFLSDAVRSCARGLSCAICSRPSLCRRHKPGLHWAEPPSARFRATRRDELGPDAQPVELTRVSVRAVRLPPGRLPQDPERLEQGDALR